MKKVFSRFAVAGMILFLLGSFFMACEQPGANLTDDDVDVDDGVDVLGITLISVSPSATNIALDGERTRQFSVVVTGTGDFAETVTWEVLGNASAETTISGTGLLTVAAGEAIDRGITVKAVSTQDTAQSGTATVTVYATADDIPSEIASAEDFKKIGVDDTYPLDGNYTLVADISLAMDESWAGIASGAKEVFTGTFDGGGHTITLTALAVSDNTVNPDKSSGAYGDRGGGILTGLFANIDGTAEDRASVKNLTVDVNATLRAAPTTSLSAGIIAGYSGKADFENITLTGYVSVTNTAKPIYLGGIVGTAHGSTIKNCVNKAEIHGTGKAPGGAYDKAGGIVGTFNGGTVISNCHNTGDIFIVSTQQNGFAGGIAGGSSYDMIAVYHGIIEDCSSSGDIDAQGGNFWSFAGGIAGTITGQTRDGNNHTRIVRCHASGTITASDSGWSYVGGIVGNNYMGALVSQCYFEGNVKGTVPGTGGEVSGTDPSAGFNYAGGIAGYNSAGDNAWGYTSTIEDCWSSGTVTGTFNAGGVVGQNQVNAEIRRCYSTAAVSVTTTAGIYGAGGITGLNQNNFVPNAVELCVALNQSVKATNGDGIHRVIGSKKTADTDPHAQEEGTAANNYAWKDMQVTTGGEYTADVGIDAMDGADCEAKPAQSFYADTLSWNFDTVWKMDGDYPALQWQ